MCVGLSSREGYTELVSIEMRQIGVGRDEACSREVMEELRRLLFTTVIGKRLMLPCGGVAQPQTLPWRFAGPRPTNYGRGIPETVLDFNHHTIVQ